MKTCNAQIEDVKELLHNIVGVAVGYDGYSNKDSLKNLIDEMSVWACEALKILEELPRDSRERDVRVVQPEPNQTFVCNCGTTINSWCPIHGAKK